MNQFIYPTMLIVAVLLVVDLFVEFLSSTLVTVIVQFSWVRFCTAGGWGWGGCSKLYNVGLHQRINCPPLGCTHWKPPAVRYGQMLSFTGVYVTFKVQLYGFFWLHSVPTYVTEVSLWSTSRVYLLTFLDFSRSSFWRISVTAVHSNFLAPFQ